MDPSTGTREKKRVYLMQEYLARVPWVAERGREKRASRMTKSFRELAVLLAKTAQSFARDYPMNGRALDRNVVDKRQKKCL